MSDLSLAIGFFGIIMMLEVALFWGAGYALQFGLIEALLLFLVSIRDLG